MSAGRTYTERADALIRATERRSRIAERITHLVRDGATPPAGDPVWAELEAALNDEDEARAEMRAFISELRRSG